MMELNRLETVAEPGGKNIAYNYDASGNRATETITQSSNTTVSTYNYDDLNKLDGIETKLNNTLSEKYTFQYDDNGNQKYAQRDTYSGGAVQATYSTNYSYNVFNELVLAVMPNGSTMSYFYNAEGLRIQKCDQTNNNKSTYYFYEYDKVVLELGANDVQEARNIYGSNLISRMVSGTTLYYMYNGHGDVTALADVGTNQQNLAAGKTLTGSVSVTNAVYATDGDTNTGKYTSIGSNLQNAKLDLGQSQMIDKVKLWRYYADSRQYKDVIIQFSNDTNFSTGVTTVFNNDTDNSAGKGVGTNSQYAESSAGKTITFKPISARYMRIFSNGSTVNTNNHIVEVQVFKSRVVGAYYYDAFGNITEQTGNADNNITYAGYQHDKESGLYYCNARMYDPKIARFLQEDTYTGEQDDPLSLNLYTYCSNEPLMYSDPTGHAAVFIDGVLQSVQADYMSGWTGGKVPGNERLYVKVSDFMDAIKGGWAYDKENSIVRTDYNNISLDYYLKTGKIQGSNGSTNFSFYFVENRTYVPIANVSRYFGMSVEYVEDYNNGYYRGEAVFIRKSTNVVCRLSSKIDPFFKVFTLKIDPLVHRI